MKTKSLNSKFIMFVICLIIPIGICNIISLGMSKKIEARYSTMLNNMLMTNEIRQHVDNSLDDFNQYILNGSRDKKANYDIEITLAKQKINTLKINSDNVNQYILRDLDNTLESYIEKSNNTITAYENREGYIFYYDDFIAAKNIASYCDTHAATLMQNLLETSSITYKELNRNSNVIYVALTIYLIVILALCVLYALVFIRNISGGLKGIVETSNKVSKGQFEYYEGNKTDIYELDILIETFNTMVKDIKELISSINEKLLLEKKLKEEEMKNLQYENALKEFDLKVLQSQINPHFLFNTLNCINSTAMMENATTTSKLIKSVSNILRYSLRSTSTNALLEDEIKIVEDYIYIQECRFDDRIKFNLSANMDMRKVKVPGMTIQPLVENAFIHGIEGKEEGGYINIAIYAENDECNIVIEDNGVGISKEILDKINNYDYNTKHTGHTTGLGINMVEKRLRYLYNKNNMFKMESEEGKGTRVYLKIPIMEDESNDEDINC
ncbi:sensor histidine kinase [Clostridium sp. YIM B02555]|uniref:sensor histidine kinase n=1 Tax=Clostridium sp. YIM B02555 TaxID=2911968 RepID=UPI001EEE3DAE|nr:sensor histidine kinase [Clostridium sp. YIM B02555]